MRRMTNAPKNPMANTALNHKADMNVDVELSKLDNEKNFIRQYRVVNQIG